ncbi:hypothetical protein, partial [Salmonella sp. s54836]|uniref:hypothetical protein n=1 Tax=Salmonella sp. s54836 TaxID=3159673 RepID=UPI00397FFF04
SWSHRRNDSLVRNGSGWRLLRTQLFGRINRLDLAPPALIVFVANVEECAISSQFVQKLVDPIRWRDEQAQV